MVQPGGEPTKTDALERRTERLQEEYAQALKMKKVKDKLDDLEFELYVKKAERNQLRLEISTNRKVDILV
jgi:hypothetical protein